MLERAGLGAVNRFSETDLKRVFSVCELIYEISRVTPVGKI